MSLLFVLVKEAHIDDIDHDNYNSYVVVKIGDVKSTTLATRGLKPIWEQEFCFELNENNNIDVDDNDNDDDENNNNNNNNGLIIELWNRGMLWDKLLGLNWITLNNIINNYHKYNHLWFSLDSELCFKDGIHIIGTKNPTNHNILIELRVEHLSIENNIINFDDDLAQNINSIINNSYNFNLNENNNNYNDYNFLQQQQQQQQQQQELLQQHDDNDNDDDEVC